MIKLSAPPILKEVHTFSHTDIGYGFASVYTDHTVPHTLGVIPSFVEVEVTNSAGIFMGSDVAVNAIAPDFTYNQANQAFGYLINSKTTTQLVIRCYMILAPGYVSTFKLNLLYVG